MEGQQPGFGVVLSGDGVRGQMADLIARTCPRRAFGEGGQPGVRRPVPRLAVLEDPTWMAAGL